MILRLVPSCVVIMPVKKSQQNPTCVVTVLATVSCYEDKDLLGGTRPFSTVAGPWPLCTERASSVAVNHSSCVA